MRQQKGFCLTGTGLKNVYLQQFHVFGDPGRSRESLIGNS